MICYHNWKHSVERESQIRLQIPLGSIQIQHHAFIASQQNWIALVHDDASVDAAACHRHWLQLDPFGLCHIQNLGVFDWCAVSSDTTIHVEETFVSKYKRTAYCVGDRGELFPSANGVSAEAVDTVGLHPVTTYKGNNEIVNG